LLRSSLQRFGCSPFSVVSSDSCKVSLVFRIDKAVSVILNEVRNVM